MKDCVPRRILKQREKATRKWITGLNSLTDEMSAGWGCWGIWYGIVWKE